MAVELLQYQREQLQVNILDPLQEIKKDIGRRLQRKEVQTIKSFLSKDIQREVLEKANDGEVLVEVLDQFYGKDSLKFIERLLSKAKCQDLVEMLQDWKSNKKIMDSNIFHQFGFFPLWIKINYTFNEFSKRRAEIFNTLKNVFAIPQTDGNPASECIVYMGVSLGKRDVLTCVLVPHCVRQSIRTSLQYQDTALQLRTAHVTGIYYSRIKSKNSMSLSHNKNEFTGSDLSISSAMSSDFGELCDPVYEDMNNNYSDVQQSSILQDYQPQGLHKDQNFNNIENDLYTNGRKGLEDVIPYNVTVKADFRNQGNYKVSSVRPYRENDSADIYPRSQGNHSVSPGRPYREGVNMDTGPAKLVHANYGYIDTPPKLDSTSSAPEESEKFSYGACFFVDKNSSPRKVYSKNCEAWSVGSNDSDHIEPPGRASHSGLRGNARAVYPTSETPKEDEEGMRNLQRDVSRTYIDVNDSTPERYRTRESPRSDQEAILFSRKTEFSFEEPTRFDSDHERELLDWSRNVNQNDREMDEDPSLWYQPRQTTDNASERYEPHDTELEDNYGRSPLNSSDAQRDGQEKTNSPFKLQDYDLKPGYWQDDERGSSYHRDAVGYHSNEQVHSSLSDYGMSDNLEERQGLSYQGGSIGHHSDDGHPSNHADYQRLGNYGDEHVIRNHADFLASSNHRYDEDQHPSYYGNGWTNENQLQCFMEAEPEPEPSPMTSRLSSEERNGQVGVRQSTPSSSSSGFITTDQSVILRSDKISRSMPSLHAKQNEMFVSPQPRWSDSSRSNGYHRNCRKHMSKYESEADLEDNVFVDSYNNSVKFKVSPPPYCPPPDYQETMIRKSYLSLSSCSVSLDSKRMKAKSPLLSSQSVTCIYKEKESFLSRQELQESILSAEEKQWEILLEKSKELIIAAKMGDEDEVRSLLEEEVDVDYKNEFGHTALMTASREGHLEVIHVLIAHGADMNIQDKYGKSALHEAAWSGKHQVVNALLSNEAEMNCVDEEGRTPLQYASLRGKTRVVEVLLRFGAEDSILNKDGESAVEIAYGCRHKDIVKMLLKSTDKKSRKIMKGKIRKQRIQRITTAASLPNLTKATSLKTLRRSRSKPDVNKKGTCVIQ